MRIISFDGRTIGEHDFPGLVDQLRILVMTSFIDNGRTSLRASASTAITVFLDWRQAKKIGRVFELDRNVEARLEYEFATRLLNGLILAGSQGVYSALSTAYQLINNELEKA